jgi:hypothetical protein
MMMQSSNKQCSKCLVLKPVTDFRKNKNQCKQCWNLYIKNYYNNNPAKRLQNRALVARSIKRRGQALSAWYTNLKRFPCSDCKNSFHPFVMDFDHIKGEKLKPVSQLVMQLASKRAILAEIAKCELVCSNCHRIRTLKRRIGEENFLKECGALESHQLSSGYEPDV